MNPTLELLLREAALLIQQKKFANAAETLTRAAAILEVGS